METPPAAHPHQCNVRECISRFLQSFSPPLPAVIDPRVPAFIPHAEADLQGALIRLANEAALLPAAGPRTLVVHEKDDPTRCLLRFEISGTVLGFTFPNPAGSGGSPLPAAKPLKILVAEDNLINQQLAIECLRNLGYECHMVCDGAAAVEAVRHHPYDLIFMDIHMPVMDGLAASRAIRRLAGGEFPYIAALTAYAMPGDKRRALEAGMDEYLTKPCRLETLGGVIKKVLNRKF